MTEEQLDLLEFAAGGPAHFRARAPKVVGSNAWDTSRCRVLLEQLPDDLLAQCDGPNPTAALHGTKHRTVDHPGRRDPQIDCILDPRRHRNGPNAPVLADEVHDAPPGVPQ